MQNSFLNISALICFCLLAYTSARAEITPPGALRALANLEAIDPSPKIELPQEITVNQAEVELAAIVDLSQLRGLDRELLSNFPIAQFPEGKDELELPGSYLENRVREKLGSTRNIRIHAPAKVKLILGKRRLPRADIERFVLESLAKKVSIPADARLDARVENVYATIEYARDGEVRMEIPNPTLRPAKRLNVEITTRDKQGKIQQRHIVSVVLAITAKRWVAKRALSPQEALEPSDFELKEVELSANEAADSLPLEQEQFSAYLKGAKLRRALQAGAFISARNVHRAMDILPGSLLRVKLTNTNGLELITRGRSLGGGTLGQEIKVRLDKSGRVVSGELIEKDLMEVNL